MTKFYRVVKRLEWYEESHDITLVSDTYTANEHHKDMGEWYFTSRKKAQEFRLRQESKYGSFSDGTEWHEVYDIEEVKAR